MADNSLTPKEEFLLNPVTEHNITDAAIATFETNLRHPVKVEIPLEPIQDLHGMPNPYPAGTSVNLIPDTTDTSNGYVAEYHLNSDGSTTANANWYISEYIPLNAETTYTWSNRINTSNLPAICFYDENKTFISGIAINKQYSHTFTPPEGAVYCRSSQSLYTHQEVASTNPAFQLEVGSTATEYRRYSNICPISGWIEAEIEQRRKNLLIPDNPENPMQNWTHTSTGTVKYSAEYGGFYSDGFGVAQSKQAGKNEKLFIAPKNMTVTFSVDVYDTRTTYGIRFYLNDARITDIHGLANQWTRYTYTCQMTAGEYLGITVYGGIYWKNLQVVYGTSADQYYPYVANTIPINWQSEAGTIYRGTVTLNEDGSADVVAQHWILRDMSKFSSIAAPSASSGLYAHTFNLKNWATTWDKAGGALNMICEVGIIGQMGSNYHIWGVDSTSDMYFYDNTISTVSEFKTKYTGCYILYRGRNRNQTYHFPNVGQLKAFLGTNNVWSDIGNVNVKYLTQNSETGMEYRGDRALELRRRAMLADAPTIHTTVGSSDTGGFASFKSYVKAPVKSVTIPFTPKQEGTGDPSPDNVRPISGWTGCELHNDHEAKSLSSYDYNTINAYIVYDAGAKGHLQTHASNRTVIIPLKENTFYKYTWNRSARSGDDDSNLLLFEAYPAVNVVADRPYSNLIRSGQSATFFSGTKYKYVAIKIAHISRSNTTETINRSTFVEGTYLPVVFTDPTTGDPLTVYGGTVTLNEDGSVDIISTWYGRTFNGSENWTTQNPSSLYAMKFIVSLPALGKPQATTNSKGKTNYIKTYKVSNEHRSDGVLCCLFGWGDSKLYVMNATKYLEGVTDLTSFKAYLSEHNLQVAYPLATPITYHFDNVGQLKSFIGQNTVWTDLNGDPTVTFWKHG